MSARIVSFAAAVDGQATVPLEMVRPSEWRLRAESFCGVPFRMHLGISVLDCWVDGHLLELEVIGPGGEPVLPVLRALLPRGDPADGFLTVVKRLDFTPDGSHAIQVRLDRRWAGEIRFQMREPAWAVN